MMDNCRRDTLLCCDDGTFYLDDIMGLSKVVGLHQGRLVFRTLEGLKMHGDKV
jgi:hypothetical protein